jgi:hypothetical protein
VLQVVNGAYAGRKIWLQPGQIAEIGSSADMDFSFPHDAQMAALHFALICGHENCQVRTLGTLPTFVNGEATDDVCVRHGDRLRAGKTEFNVRIDGQVLSSTDSPGKSGPDEEPSPEPPLITPEQCERFGLSDAAKARLGAGLPIEEFLNVLVEHGDYTDALKTLANVLAKREAIWWGCQCLSGRVTRPAAVAAREAAVLWVRDPTEERRRECKQAATLAGHHTPAAQIAMAVFFSGGSIAPAGLSEVAPDETITAHCIAGGLMMLAVQCQPQTMADAQMNFIEQGRNTLRGLDPW